MYSLVLTNYGLGWYANPVRIFSTFCHTNIIPSAFHSCPFTLIRNSTSLSRTANFIVYCSLTKTVPLFSLDTPNFYTCWFLVRDTVPWIFKWGWLSLTIQICAQVSSPLGSPRPCYLKQTLHPCRFLFHCYFVLFIPLTYHYVTLSYVCIY